MDKLKYKFWKELTRNSVKKDVTCVDEWDILYKLYYNCGHRGKVIKEEDKNCHSCICGEEHIYHIFEMENRFNHNIVKVGSRCVEKFLKDNLKSYKKKIKKINKEIEEIKKVFEMNHCDHCDKFYKKNHLCLYDKINEEYKKKLKDKEFKKKILNSKERWGQGEIIYNFLMERKETIDANNKMVFRYDKLVEELKKLKNEE